MVERGILVRERLREKLRLLGCPGSWDHLIQQGGLYCCTGLNGEQTILSPVSMMFRVKINWSRVAGF